MCAQRYAYLKLTSEEKFHCSENMLLWLGSLAFEMGFSVKRA